MNVQNLIADGRAIHVRELRNELAKAKAENQALREENAALREHFDLALAAARDLGALAAGARFYLVDGWNLILGANRLAASREELEKNWRAHLDAHPADFVWIVYDGKYESSREDRRLRVSYTGGIGLHRADRFSIDFLRMARWLTLADRVSVVTRDKDFRREAERLGALTADKNTEVSV